MSLPLSLLIAALTTWIARASFIALLPSDRLPERLVVALESATPAVLGALTVLAWLNSRTGDVALLPHVAPLCVAAGLALRGVNLALVVLAALVTGAALQLLGI